MFFFMRVLAREEHRNLTNREQQRVSPSVHESLIKGLTLEQYVVAKSMTCSKTHFECKNCQPMITASSVILEKRFVPLSVLWNISFPNRLYDSEKAQRRFLQMPVTALNVGGKVYLTAKREHKDYSSIKEEISTSAASTTQSKPTMDSRQFQDMLNSVESDAERNRLKHTIGSACNVSTRQASATYKISRMKDRALAVSAASQKAKEIKKMHDYLARVEQRAFLTSQGIEYEKYLEESSSEDDSEDEEESISDNESEGGASVEVSRDGTDCLAMAEKRGAIAGNTENNHDSGPNDHDEQTKDRPRQQTAHSPPSEKNAPELDLNSVVVLDILREVQCNWFAFVGILQPKFEAQGYSEEVFDQFLLDFASQLSHLGLSDEEFNLTEQSRFVYLDAMRRNETLADEIASDSSDEEGNVVTADSSADDHSDDQVKRILKQIKDKARKRAVVEIAKNRLLRNKISTSAKSIEKTYPDIGKVMESIAEASDVGADKWRRTGVYTFSGDPKKVKRLTFKRLQEKLSDHYGRHFSYGTVIQLCVPKNKKRLSSKRYKNVAQIKYQRARKSFAIKFNPDTQWSRSLYKSLDKLQCDGTHSLLLNRDDQAGFRLDSTYTHKMHGQLGVKKTSTTRTDFLNKHPSQLQTTSYNFTQTATTNEVCIGVVKATVLHSKSPSQHAADMQMLSEKDSLRPVFFKNPYSTEPITKDVEFIRVDGGCDEGPSHNEVQFVWTERHISRSTRATMVTTRCSGDSFLNRVELQNGCLARGHSNLFIPSTLHGAPFGDDGSFSEEKHKMNMSTAIDQYIHRVDETPCMKTSIRLYQGVDQDHLFLQRRGKLLKFLRGTKKDKAELERSDPTLYRYFTEVWKVRNNHIDKTLPTNYVFLLRCCGMKECPHPLCQGMYPRRTEINIIVIMVLILLFKLILLLLVY